jgi:hypothetical protein
MVQEGQSLPEFIRLKKICFAIPLIYIYADDDSGSA